MILFVEFPYGVTAGVVVVSVVCLGLGAGLWINLLFDELFPSLESILLVRINAWWAVHNLLPMLAPGDMRAHLLWITDCSRDNPSVLPGVGRRSIFSYLVAIIWSDTRRLSYMYRLFSGLFLAIAVAQLGCRGTDTRTPGIILMRYNPGSQSTEQRETGF